MSVFACMKVLTFREEERDRVVCYVGSWLEQQQQTALERKREGIYGKELEEEYLQNREILILYSNIFVVFGARGLGLRGTQIGEALGL